MLGERGASETIGTMLMVAVVVVSVSGTSVALVTLQHTGPSEPTVSLDATLGVNDVSVTNTGSGSVNASELRVVVRGPSGKQTAFTPDRTTVSGADAILDPGETIRKNLGLGLSPNDRATVIVVHRPTDSVLFTASISVRGRATGRATPVQFAGEYTIRQNERLDLAAGVSASSYEWQTSSDLVTLSTSTGAETTLSVPSAISRPRTVTVFVKAYFSNGSTVTRKAVVHVRPETDTSPPRISAYDVTAPNGSLHVSFASNESLRTIRVKTAGPQTKTVSTAAFTAQNDSGTWRYDATIPVSKTGEYAVRLVDARDRAGNDYGGTLSKNATVTGDGPPTVSLSARRTNATRLSASWTVSDANGPSDGASVTVTVENDTETVYTVTTGWRNSTNFELGDLDPNSQYVVTVTADDGEGETATESERVALNQPPVIEQFTVNETGNSGKYDVYWNASDAEGWADASVNLTVYRTDTGAVVETRQWTPTTNPETGSVNDLTLDNKRSYRFVLTVRDGDGGETTATRRSESNGGNGGSRLRASDVSTTDGGYGVKFSLENTADESVKITKVAVSTGQGPAKKVSGSPTLIIGGTTVFDESITIGGDAVSIDSTTLATGESAKIVLQKFQKKKNKDKKNKRETSVEGKDVTLTFYFADGTSESVTITP